MYIRDLCRITLVLVIGYVTCADSNARRKVSYISIVVKVLLHRAGQ
jgi:hypothetical protein